MILSIFIVTVINTATSLPMTDKASIKIFTVFLLSPNTLSSSAKTTIWCVPFNFKPFWFSWGFQISYYISFFLSLTSLYLLAVGVEVIVAPVHIQWPYTHTHTHTHTTLGRTPIDEGSARRRDLYLYNTQYSQEKHPFPWRDSHPQFQQASVRTPTPYTAQPLGPANITYPRTKTEASVLYEGKDKISLTSPSVSWGFLHTQCECTQER